MLVVRYSATEVTLALSIHCVFAYDPGVRSRTWCGAMNCVNWRCRGTRPETQCSDIQSVKCGTVYKLDDGDGGGRRRQKLQVVWMSR